MSEIDLSVIFNKIAEGNLAEGDVPEDYTLKKRKSFRKMIVLEVISDPKTNNEEDENERKWLSMNVSNIRYAKLLPRNTIVAKDIGVESDPEFVFPFFSHLSMPCKAGESVWVITEDPSSDMSYWMTKVVEIHRVDDVNHTHPGRYLESSQAASTKSQFEKEDSGKGDSIYWHELRNGPPIQFEGSRTTAGKKVLLRGHPEDIFEQLVTGSKAADLTYYESVPRFKKRPGDVVLEGSNNTLLVLGNDRTGPLDKTLFKESAGSIDIVTGRGQTDKTYGKSVETTSITGVSGDQKGKKIKTELDKTAESLEQREGDPDFTNDRSRILVSHRTNVDKNFGIDEYNSKLDLTDNVTNGDSSIVIKSDKVRLIARSDVEILVTGFTSRQAPDKTSIKDENTDQTKWASIVINSKGEIIIKPSQSGVIKLGSEKADKAIFCTKSINSGAGGTVVGKPVATTMGGQVGLPGENSPTGEWAKKVLID